MAQQTAVDYLVNELRLNLTIYKHTKNVIEQAKAMEKEQIMQSYNDGKSVIIHIEENKSLEQYYTETYNK